MIKLLAVFKPCHNKGRDECLEHYRYEHSRVCASAPEFNRYMAKYVQNCAINGLGPKRILTTDWAGVTEAWFYNEEAYRDAFADPAYKPIEEDEERFANLNGLVRLAATPSWIFGCSRDTPIKYFRFSCFSENCNRASAKKFWESTYAAAVSRDGRVRKVVASYVQNRPSGFSIPTSAKCEIADEFWIEHIDHLPEFFAAESALRKSLDYDSGRFIDTQHQIQIVTQAKLIWDLGENPVVALTRIRRWD